MNNLTIFYLVIWKVFLNMLGALLFGIALVGIIMVLLIIAAIVVKRLKRIKFGW